MSKSNREQLQTIDPAALAQVSGGAAPAGATNNEQVLTALTGILESIQSLAGQPRQGFSQQEMLLFMMMMQQRNQQLAASSGWSAWSQEPIIRYY